MVWIVGGAFGGVAAIVISVHLWGSDRWQQAVRSLVPLSIACAGAVFAYYFPLRLQSLREFEAVRLRIRDVAQRLLAVRATDVIDVSICVEVDVAAREAFHRLKEMGLDGELPQVLAAVQASARQIHEMHDHQDLGSAERMKLPREERLRVEEEYMRKRHAEQRELLANARILANSVAFARCP